MYICFFWGEGILGIMEDKDHNLWIETNGGVSIYDGQFRTMQEMNQNVSTQLCHTNWRRSHRAPMGTELNRNRLAAPREPK